MKWNENKNKKENEMTWNENKKWKEDEIENENEMKTKMKWKRKWNEWMRMGAHKVGRRFPKNYI